MAKQSTPTYRSRKLEPGEFACWLKPQDQALIVELLREELFRATPAFQPKTGCGSQRIVDLHLALDRIDPHKEYPHTPKEP